MARERERVDCFMSNIADRVFREELQGGLGEVYHLSFGQFSVNLSTNELLGETPLHIQLKISLNP